MYKQFASLSAHSLLMQQVELLDLQRELDVQAERDNKQIPGFDKKATTLIHSQPPNDRQWQLVLTIRRLEGIPQVCDDEQVEHC